MLKREHCALCDNHKFSLQKGIYCSLTNEQPAFDNKCELIKIDEDAKKAIVEIDSKLIVLEKQRLFKKVAFAAASTLGFALLFLSYYFTKQSFKYDRINEATFIIGSMAISIIVSAAHNLRKHKSDYKMTLDQKENMDAVFDHYNIAYDTNVKMEKVHGEYEFDYDIVFK